MAASLDTFPVNSLIFQLKEGDCCSSSSGGSQGSRGSTIASSVSCYLNDLEFSLNMDVAICPHLPAHEYVNYGEPVGGTVHRKLATPNYQDLADHGHRVRVLIQIHHPGDPGSLWTTVWNVINRAPDLDFLVFPYFTVDMARIFLYVDGILSTQCIRFAGEVTCSSVSSLTPPPLSSSSSASSQPSASGSGGPPPPPPLNSSSSSVSGTSESSGSGASSSGGGSPQFDSSGSGASSGDGSGQFDSSASGTSGASGDSSEQFDSSGSLISGASESSGGCSGVFRLEMLVSGTPGEINGFSPPEEFIGGYWNVTGNTSEVRRSFGPIGPDRTGFFTWDFAETVVIIVACPEVGPI